MDEWKGWGSVHNNVIETRREGTDDSTRNSEMTEPTTQLTTQQQTDNNRRTILQSILLQQETSIFESTEAHKLFNAKEEENTVDTISRQIEMLESVNRRDDC